MIDSEARAVESNLPDLIAGRYKVQRVLGRGGMATVYLCEDLQATGLVAVKVLRPEIGSAVVVERFLREIALASELDHPRIPKVLDSGVAGDLPFYVMTYVEGESLRSLLDRKKQLTIDEAGRIAVEIFEPTSYAHSRGIVHRDLKPENILLGHDGVYVLDFGVARAILESASDRLTSTGIAVGTPAYMSPEQALSDKDLDARSDIYSLGCLVYEMIAGIPPFVGATAQVVMSRRFAAPAPPLSETRDGVPAGVQHAVAKALARSPADRWQTVEAFSNALTAPPLSESVQEVQSHVDRRRLWYMRGLLVTVGVAAVTIAGLAWRSSRDPLVRAQSALMLWNFDDAEAALRSAVTDRVNDGPANLWLAQTLMLKGSPAGDWDQFALIAAESGDLDPVDLKRAEALAALANGNRAIACARFDDLRKLVQQKRRNDFTATLAFADCLRSDSTVVRDASSPSGYRYAASYHFIDSLYGVLASRASANPAAYPVLLRRFERVLDVDPRLYRAGRIRDDSNAPVVSQPVLVADTIAYIPYRRSATGAPVDFGPPELLAAARKRNLQRLRAFIEAWSSAQPDNADAHEAYASLLESYGEIDDDRTTVLEELIAARTLRTVANDQTAEGHVRRLRLATAHVRNLIRAGNFEYAGLLADSTVKPSTPTLPDPLRDQATELVWILSAVRGDVAAVISLEQRYASRYQIGLSTGPEQLPLALARDAISLGNYSGFGGPADSILSIAARLNDRIPTLIAPASVEETSKVLLSRPLTLAAPVIGVQHVVRLGQSADPMVNAMRAFHAGNTRLTRSRLDSLAALHADRPPGEITMDVTYLHAWLRSAIGDTAIATRLLDNALRGIAKAPPSMMSSPVLTASLVRGILLRAALAAKAGDSSIANRWHSAASQLWGVNNPLLTIHPVLEKN